MNLYREGDVKNVEEMRRMATPIRVRSRFGLFPRFAEGALALLLSTVLVAGCRRADDKRLEKAHQHIKNWLRAREEIKKLSGFDQIDATRSWIEAYNTTVKHDVDYVIEKAPKSHPRRQAAIELRELMAEINAGLPD